jgi:16S rRNA pseudouridine516 synthase
MRLDKWICHSTGLSRPQVQRAVRAGHVTVNGLTLKKADRQLYASDTVTLDGTVVAIPVPRYFMLHKPAGYVCANTDGSHPVVLDLLDENRIDELQIAGRLDIDTTGLVLITDDGQWNHRVTAPARLCKKTYRVFLHEPLSAQAAETLRNGVQLHGEKKPTQTAELVFAADKTDEVYLTIQEGKYHQVKRMFAAVNNVVVGLHRESIGAIALDTALQAGDYRKLTDAEIASIR